MQITFRNIAAPSFRESGDFLNSAQDSFQGATDGLSRLILQRQQNQQEAVANEREGNAGQFSNFLAGIGTPEELAAAQESGLVDRTLASFNGVIDERAARAELDARRTGLRTDLLANQQFQDNQTDRAQASTIDQFGQLLASGDVDGAQRILADNELRNEADLQQRATDTRRSILEQGRADTQFQRGEDQFQQARTVDNLIEVARTFGDGNERDALNTLNGLLRQEALPASVATAARAGLRESFQIANGPTRQEAEDNSIAQQRAIDSVDLANQLDQNTLDQQLSRRPETSPFSFDNADDVTTGDAVSFAGEISPGDSFKSKDSARNGLAAVQKRVQERATTRGVPLPEGIPWGAILLEGVTRAGTESDFSFGFGDPDVVQESVERETLRVFDEWLIQSTNSVLNLDARNAALTSAASRRAALNLPRPN